MAILHEFSVGHCTHPACMALKGAGLASRCFPSRAYLIETRDRLLLWDTGYAEHFHTATRQGIYRLYPLVTPVTFNVADALSSQLQARGVSQRDIHALVLSHFHADHIAGLRDFPQAQLWCSAAGWQAVRGLSGLAALRQAFLPALLPADIDSRLHFVEALELVDLPAELAPFTQARDLSGTGEVLVVDLPGHAPGHLGAFVRTEQGWTLLASDAAWAREGFQDLRGPAELTFLIQHQRAAYYQTLGRLHALYRNGLHDIRLTHQQEDGPA